MKCYKLKIDFQIIFKLFSKLKQFSRTEKDNHLFMQIIKLLLSVQRFYKISLKQISKENSQEKSMITNICDIQTKLIDEVTKNNEEQGETEGKNNKEDDEEEEEEEDDQ